MNNKLKIKSMVVTVGNFLKPVWLAITFFFGNVIKKHIDRLPLTIYQAGYDRGV